MTSSTNLPVDDRRNLSLRLTALQVVVSTVFAALAVAFWVFQVAQHQKFDEMAENNHRRRLPLPAPRGVLFDRHGKVLVENQNTFNIALDREQSGDIDDTLRLLAAATGADEAKMRETVNRRRREPSYRPIVLVENATFEQVVAFRARRLELPGIIEQQVPARQYPRSEMGAHLFGYVERSERGGSDETGVCRRRARVDGGEGRRRAVVQQAADGQGRRQAWSSSTAAAARWGRPASSCRSKDDECS